jgi:mono/diheme cytochrome c family protein
MGGRLPDTGPDYDLWPMSRLVKILGPVILAVAVAAVTAACGTEKISVPKSAGDAYNGAVIFSERCAGCHTLSYAGTHGSAPNVRTAQAISGPNFDTRCERPIDRVLYAIENGGFSGAYMPQNIVVGQDAIDVAKFVSTYAGRKAPKLIGVTPCVDRAIGELPAGGAQSAAAAHAGAPASSNTATTAADSSASGSASTTPTKSASAPAANHKGHKKSVNS